MATDFTSHYNLDKYVATDKPNLRDQYNSAMDKIDLALLSANTNATEAKNTVLNFDEDLSDLQDALPLSAFSQTTVQQALNGKASTSALAAEATARENAITAEATARTNADNALTTLINTKADINRGKVVVLIGDSYGEGYTPDGNVTGWCQTVANYLSQIGITAKYGYQGGLAIGGGSFLAKLTSVVNAMTDAEKKNCETVLIAGGYNDRSQNSSAISTGMRDIANFVRDNLPNARCICSFIGRCVTGITTGSHSADTMNSVKEAAKNWYLCGGQYGIFVDLTGLACLNQNSLFSSDYVHPNASGIKQISIHIVAILGGMNVGNAHLGDAVQDVGNFTGADGWTLYTEQKQVLASTDVYGFATGFIFGTTGNAFIEVRRTTAKSMTFGIASPYLVGTMHIACLCGMSFAEPVTVVAHSTGGEYITVQGFIIVNDAGNVTLSLIDTLNNNYRTIECDRLQIRPNYVTFH